MFRSPLKCCLNSLEGLKEQRKGDGDVWSSLEVARMVLSMRQQPHLQTKLPIDEVPASALWLLRLHLFPSLDTLDSPGTSGG